jgi:hypothetical protein
MSLLEVVLAVTLLAIVAPLLFAIFYSNANLSKSLETQSLMRQIADDMRTFVHLADYGGINSMASGGDLLAIREVEDENGLLVRKFVKNDGAKAFSGDFVTRVEIMNRGAEYNGEQERCAIPLRCRVFHVKRRKSLGGESGALGKKYPLKFDAEYSTFLVKNM